MIGNAKFEVGDKVKFTISGEDKIGYIEIVDEYGTLFDDDDVSYDILVFEDGSQTLYKHINESNVVKTN